MSIPAAGRLNRLIIVEACRKEKDPKLGEVQETWVKHAEVWASVLDILQSQAEKTTVDLRLGTRPRKILIRYRDTIDMTMRIRLPDRNNALLKITSIAEVGQREALEIMTEEYSA